MFNIVKATSEAVKEASCKAMFLASSKVIFLPQPTNKNKQKDSPNNKIFFFHNPSPILKLSYHRKD